ncbi:MAG: hypothetical protein U1E02_01560 [Hydrogenophaga sp.]|nr:hypothetical protein [Hydrogenophaga sp.]
MIDLKNDRARWSMQNPCKTLAKGYAKQAEAQVFAGPSRVLFLSGVWWSVRVQRAQKEHFPAYKKEVFQQPVLPFGGT